MRKKKESFALVKTHIGRFSNTGKEPKEREDGSKYREGLRKKKVRREFAWGPWQQTD